MALKICHLKKNSLNQHVDIGKMFFDNFVASIPFIPFAFQYPLTRYRRICIQGFLSSLQLAMHPHRYSYGAVSSNNWNVSLKCLLSSKWHLIKLYIYSKLKEFYLKNMKKGEDYIFRAWVGLPMFLFTGAESIISLPPIPAARFEYCRAIAFYYNTVPNFFAFILNNHCQYVLAVGCWNRNSFRTEYFTALFSASLKMRYIFCTGPCSGL